MLPPLYRKESKVYHLKFGNKEVPHTYQAYDALSQFLGSVPMQS